MKALQKDSAITKLGSEYDKRNPLIKGNENRQAQEEQERHLEGASGVQGYRNKAIPGMADRFDSIDPKHQQHN